MGTRTRSRHVLATVAVGQHPIPVPFQRGGSVVLSNRHVSTTKPDEAVAVGRECFPLTGIYPSIPSMLSQFSIHLVFSAG